MAIARLPAGMTLAIETDGLTKKFERPRGWRRIARIPAVTAVEDVSFSVPRGEMFGLLGPNGAGKTTLVKMLCTLILPTSGMARVAGYPMSDDAAIRKAVGLVVTDERSFYWRLPGRENLKFFASMHDLYGDDADRRVQEVLEDVDLQSRAEDTFSSYSSGMKQRLAIARSLLHRPDILFLDEPSRSLDPVATQRLHELLSSLMDRQGVTIFLITHDLAEAEKLCQRVAVMNKGRIQALGRPAELRQRLQRQFHYQVQINDLPEDVGHALLALPAKLEIKRETGHLHLAFRASETEETLTDVLDLLRRHDVQILSIEGAPPTLEEVFAHHTGLSEDRAVAEPGENGREAA